MPSDWMGGPVWAVPDNERARFSAAFLAWDPGMGTVIDRNIKIIIRQRVRPAHLITLDSHKDL